MMNGDVNICKTQALNEMQKWVLVMDFSDFTRKFTFKLSYRMMMIVLLLFVLFVICPVDHAYRVSSALLSLKTCTELLSSCTSYTPRSIIHSKITLHCQHKYTKVTTAIDDRDLFLSLPAYSMKIKKKLLHGYSIALLSLTLYAPPFDNHFNHGMIVRADVQQQPSFTTGTIATTDLPIASLSPPTSTTATATTTSHRINTLADFLHVLESNMVSKVVFNGINPESATVYFRSGGDVEVFGRDNGFPYYDDPRSPAGPIQLIAK